MPQYDSLIFDLDGTLWDSTEVCAESWNTALENMGLPPRDFTAADIAGIMGMQHKAIYEKMFPEASDALRKKIASECYAAEIRLIADKGASLYPGVPEGLITLSKKYPLYLLSNCLIEYLEVFYCWTGLGEYFKGSLCHGHTLKGKADNIRVLCEKYGLKNPVYIGDTGSDETACREAGVPFIYASYGFGTADKPIATVPSFSKLVQLLS